MEETAPFDPIVQADQLVQPIVVLRNRLAGVTRFGNHRQLVIGVVNPAVVPDLQNPPAVVVVPIPTEDIEPPCRTSPS